MKAYAIQQGQVEIGVIEYHGQKFAALGASVNGTAVKGYSKQNRLTNWAGKTILEARCHCVRSYCAGDWGTTKALAFQLTRGRWIVGYSLGDGCLFRGELLHSATEREAYAAAVNEAIYWSERDAEDESEES